MLKPTKSISEEPGANIEIEMDTGTYPEIGRGVAKPGRARVSLRNLKTFRSLRNPVFRLYFGGLLSHMACINMQMVARSLLAYRLAGSPSILGIMALAHALPMTCLSLFGGVIADQVQKKYILLMGQASSAVVALGVALSLTLGYLSPERPDSWWILVVASIFQGMIMGLMMPSRQAIVAEIVGEEHLMNAVALNGFGMNILRIIAPALAGFLIDAFDFEAIYYTMTGMYLLAVVFIACMPLTSTMTIRGQGLFENMKSGFQYIRHDTTILLLLIFVLFAVIFSMPYMFLMPVFADDILKVGAKGMGILISVSGIGAMTVSVILASLPNKKRGVMLLVSGLILGLALVGFSLSESWNLSLAFIALVGMGQAGRMTLGNTLIQYYVADDYRGRVMSIYIMEFGLMSFGVFSASLLAETMGVQWSICGFALIFVLLCSLALAFIPRLRDLE